MKDDIATPQGTASWAVIKEMYDIDSKNAVRLAPKLTLDHINVPGAKKMRVNLAVQVFSRTVAAAIEFMHKNNLFQIEENKTNALATACLVREFNDIFDYCDSKSLNNKNPNKRPITRQNEKIDKMQRSSLFLKNIQFKSRNVKYCLEGMIRFLETTVYMAKEFFAENPKMWYFVPGKFNQDCIENLFSSFRGKLGHNTNPSAREIGILSGRVLSMKCVMQKYQKYKNCMEEDEDEEDDGKTDWCFDGIVSLDESENDESTRSQFCSFINVESDLDEAASSSSRAEEAAGRYTTGYVLSTSYFD